jgi:hypothetical protein
MSDRRRSADEFEPGSWREVWDLTIMVMGILAGPMIAVVVGIGLLIMAFWSLVNEPILVLIPIAAFVGAAWYMTERDKKARAAFEAEMAEPQRKV